MPSHAASIFIVLFMKSNPVSPLLRNGTTAVCAVLLVNQYLDQEKNTFGHRRRACSSHRSFGTTMPAGYSYIKYEDGNNNSSTLLRSGNLSLPQVSSVWLYRVISLPFLSSFSKSLETSHSCGVKHKGILSMSCTICTTLGRLMFMKLLPTPSCLPLLSPSPSTFLSPYIHSLPHYTNSLLWYNNVSLYTPILYRPFLLYHRPHYLFPQA